MNFGHSFIPILTIFDRSLRLSPRNNCPPWSHFTWRSSELSLLRQYWCHWIWYAEPKRNTGYRFIQRDGSWDLFQSVCHIDELYHAWSRLVDRLICFLVCREEYMISGWGNKMAVGYWAWCWWPLARICLPDFHLCPIAGSKSHMSGTIHKSNKHSNAFRVIGAQDRDCAKHPPSSKNATRHSYLILREMLYLSCQFWCELIPVKRETMSGVDAI